MRILISRLTKRMRHEEEGILDNDILNKGRIILTLAGKRAEVAFPVCAGMFSVCLLIQRGLLSLVPGMMTAGVLGRARLHRGADDSVIHSCRTMPKCLLNEKSKKLRLLETPMEVEEKKLVWGCHRHNYTFVKGCVLLQPCFGAYQHYLGACWGSDLVYSIHGYVYTVNLYNIYIIIWFIFILLSHTSLNVDEQMVEHLLWCTARYDR